jgi:hypothetical protein
MGGETGGEKERIQKEGKERVVKGGSRIGWVT